jgi:hypothetical protein
MERLLTAAVDALKYAAKAGNRTSKRVDKKFREAIHLFSGIEFPPTSDPNIGGTITGEAIRAKMIDESESPLTILDALKKNLAEKVKFPSVSLPFNADES